MFKLEEAWLTLVEVVMPVVSLGSYAAIAFALMTYHAEGRLSLTPPTVVTDSAVSMTSPYGATGRSWSSLTTEGCADYTHPAPRDWSEYA